ncbi:major facilitator superfamily domain-containing protein 4 [Plakobranchus ocellatus]|uniref:Major facilitator superfamily domain-containing protein 4 n=1 Tax=Plakobranchus ocellatus TaxID=259542 RepID=A0AAV4DI51_9GAST|nr:major facilitator superfamily domain-containing protein 4 [Plakobranchus ocellatus]
MALNYKRDVVNGSSVIDTSNGETKLTKEKITPLKNKEEELNQTDWLEQTTIHTRDENISFWKLFLDSWLYVVTYCCVFGSFGVCVGFLGPTVFDLGCQTHSDMKQMNWVFFVQLIMTLVGSISAGLMAGNPQQGDLRLSGPPSGQGAGSGARTRDRRVPADLRADSQATATDAPSRKGKKEFTTKPNKLTKTNLVLFCFISRRSKHRL